MIIQKLVNEAGAQVGLPLILRPPVSPGAAFSIRIDGLDSPSGIFLSVEQTPLRWKSELNIDSLGGGISAAIETAAIQHHERINLALSEASNLIGSLEFALKETELGGTRLSLKAQSKYLPDDDPSIWLVRHLVGVFYFLRVLLFEDEDSVIAEESEGAELQLAGTRYERSRANRAMAIEIHGTDCFGCGMNPGALYGVEPKSIIHVHHLTPLSEMGGAKPVNPRTDLVPLCPNCHNFAHKRNPPYTPEEISEAIRSSIENEKI